MPLWSGNAGQRVGIPGRLIVKPSVCTGCKTCELTCAVVHSIGGVLSRSRIRVHTQGQNRFVQVTCLQCLEAACARVCPTEALRRNEATQAIEVHTGRCIGCGTCAAACPFGHMHFDPVIERPVKCDLCGGRPACAAFCPHGALEARP